MICLTSSAPPVTFIHVSRVPEGSCETLNTRAPNSEGKAFSSTRWESAPRSSSTPSCFRADPKNTGKTDRSATRRCIVRMEIVPCSKNSSIACSSAAAHVSANSGGRLVSAVPWGKPEKSTHMVERRVDSSSITCSRERSQRSILFVKMNVGTPCRSSKRQSVSVWPRTPSPASMTSTA